MLPGVAIPGASSIVWYQRSGSVLGHASHARSRCSARAPFHRRPARRGTRAPDQLPPVVRGGALPAARGRRFVTRSSSASRIASASAPSSSGSNSRPMRWSSTISGQPPDAGGDDRRPGRERLGQHEPERLVGSGKNAGPGRGIRPGEPLGAVGLDPFDPVAAHGLLAAHRRVARSHQDQSSIGNFGSQAGERRQQQAGPLARIAEARRAQQRRLRSPLFLDPKVLDRDAGREHDGIVQQVATEAARRRVAENGDPAARRTAVVSISSRYRRTTR